MCVVKRKFRINKGIYKYQTFVVAHWHAWRNWFLLSLTVSAVYCIKCFFLKKSTQPYEIDTVWNNRSQRKDCFSEESLYMDMKNDPGSTLIATRSNRVTKSDTAPRNEMQQAAAQSWIYGLQTVIIGEERENGNSSFTPKKMDGRSDLKEGQERHKKKSVSPERKTLQRVRGSRKNTIKYKYSAEKPTHMNMKSVICY